MSELLSNAWPWYVSGPLIALVMFLMLRAGESFGVSTTLRSICSMAGAGRHCNYFDQDWKSKKWGLVFVLGAIVGGFIATTFLNNPGPLQISEETIDDLKALDIPFDGGIAPLELFTWESIVSFKGFVVIILGGFFVGFGARWAGGCTSGHAITGLSNLQLPSLIAVIGFFIGGLIMTHFIFPILF